MNKLKYLLIIFIFILLEINKCGLTFVTRHCLSGMWKLRYTNNKKSKDHVFLQLNNDNSFVLRMVESNGILAIKTSKYGKINYDNNHNLFNLNYFRKKSRILISIKSINRYSYSLFGIEIPEIKYNTDNSYNIEHIIDVKNYDKTLFIREIDSDKYYIFDVSNNIDKKPFVEMSLNTLLFTQMVGFVLNYIMLKMIN